MAKRHTYNCVIPISSATVDLYKNASMGPVLIWPNIPIVVNVLFQEILALMKL